MFIQSILSNQLSTFWEAGGTGNEIPHRGFQCIHAFLAFLKTPSKQNPGDGIVTTTMATKDHTADTSVAISPTISTSGTTCRATI